MEEMADGRGRRSTMEGAYGKAPLEAPSAKRTLEWNVKDDERKRLGRTLPISA